MEYKTLCRPCAEGLRASGERLAALTAKTTKQTCDECHRRRFTLRYKVEGDDTQCRKPSLSGQPTALESGR